MKTKQMTIKNPDVAIKLTREQAINFGIDVNRDEQRGELETFGPWQIVKSFKAVCISAKYAKNSLFTNCVEKTIYGERKMSDVRQGGYELDGRVSINGKKHSCFTSSQLFEVDGKLINVAVIHARIN